MKSSAIRLFPRTPANRILERQSRQADEHVGHGGLHQPTDVEVYIDGSEDIEALERAKAERQRQAAYPQSA